jgi:hypothetical protein
MEIAYTWEITAMFTKNEAIHPNSVVQTRWEKTGIDSEGNSASFEGATTFTSDNVPVGEFIPLEQLTKEIVLNWIKSRIDESHINGIILSKIEELKNPIIEVNMPWS